MEGAAVAVVVVVVVVEAVSMGTDGEVGRGSVVAGRLGTVVEYVPRVVDNVDSCGDRAGKAETVMEFEEAALSCSFGFPSLV